MNDTVTTGAEAPATGAPAEAGTAGASATEVQGALTETLVTKSEAPAGEDKPAEEAPKGEAPAALDFATLELPEGLTLADADKETVSALATKHGLSQDAVKDLLGEYASRLKTASEGPVKAFREINEKWQNEVRADKEIGGDKLPDVVKTIGKLLDNPQFVDPGFKAALNLTGAGNNPAFVKTFYKLAKALTEGGHVSGNPPAAGKPPVGSPNALYPNLPAGT